MKILANGLNRWMNRFSQQFLQIQNKNFQSRSQAAKASQWPKAKYQENSCKKLVVQLDEVKRFIVDGLMAFKLPKTEAGLLADVLVAADYRGVYGEGIARLERFLKKISDDTIKTNTDPRILKESVATALVNGRNCLGVVIGNFCMDLAIKKALDHGIGWVNAQMSNDICLSSWYALRAMHQNLIGIVMTNNCPSVLPTNSKDALLGSNAFAFGAMGNEDHFLFDMATSVKSLSTIEYYHQKEAQLPSDDWALNNDLQGTNNSSIAVRCQNLLPAGGHKGYCLGAMIDILCGVLSDANYLTKVPRWTMDHANNPNNLGQLYIAINPDLFEPNFKDRLEDFNQCLKTSASEMKDEESEVIVPGELESDHMLKVEQDGGLCYDHLTLKRCQHLAKWLSIKPLGFAPVPNS